MNNDSSFINLSSYTSNANLSISNGLYIASFNVHRLTTHFNQVQLEIISHNYDIVAIYETWLEKSILNSSIRIDGYDLVRCDRMGRLGGGVLIYFKSTIAGRILVSSEFITPKYACEFLITEFKICNSKLLFAVIYRPPRVKHPLEFFKEVERLLPSYKHFVMTGDLNADMSTFNSYSRPIIDFIEQNALYLVPSDTTCHTVFGDSWLDIFVTTCPQAVLNYSKSFAPIYEFHDTIELKLNFLKPLPIKNFLKSRDFSNFDEDHFNEHLDNIFSNTALPDTVNELCSFFTQTFEGSLDLFAPKRTIRTSARNKPWVNAEIRKLMERRDNIYRQAKAARSLALFNEYKELRSIVSNKIDSAKNAFVSKKISFCKNSKQLWNCFRGLGITSSERISPFKYFSADSINAHFSSVSCVHPNASDVDLALVLSTPLRCDIPVFSFNEISVTDLQSALKKASSNAKGIDDISIREISCSLPSTSELILKIFNLSLSTAIFPTLWKMSLITPIPKTSHIKTLSDLRPISILCAISKLLERIVHNQITAYLDKYNLFSARQVGYRKFHNTQSALIEVTDEVKLGMDRGELTLLILFDLSKALDTVNHSLLLNKLRTLNFDDNVISWFHSYLSSRAQAVQEGIEKTSNLSYTSCGVPQGSVLGPLLFLLFVNDVPHIFNFSKVLLFVDDTQIYLRFHPANLDEAVKRISQDAAAFVHWIFINGLSPNLGKTKAMILGSKRLVSSINLSTCPQIFVNGQHIEYVTFAKDLGLWIDHTLSWDVHVSKIVSKVNSILFALKMHRNALSLNVKKYLVKTLIFPHVDYACVPLINCSDVLNLNLKLKRALNSAIRFIYRIPRFFHISHQIETKLIGLRSTKDVCIF